MNNEEFDQLIKNNVTDYSVSPSSSLGKSLSRKMFFRNIWIFHKKKAIILLLFIGVSSLLFLDSKSEQEKNNIAAISQIEKDISKTPFDTNLKDKKTSNNTTEEKSSLKATITKEKNNLTNELKNSNQPSYKESQKEPTTKNIFSNPNSQTDKIEKVNLPNSNKSNISLDEIRKEKNPSKTIEDESKILNITRKDARYISTVINSSLVEYKEKDRVSDDYVKENKSSISIDAFITPYNQTKITNSIANQYTRNWKDFYAKDLYVNSKMEAGIRFNYKWNNIVVSTGVNFERVVENTPDYIYANSDDPLLLEEYKVSEMSGVKLNNSDSSQYIFYAAQDDELIESISENAYNRINYLAIPLKLGYEFEASSFSIIVQGGIVYNRLLNTKGNYLKRYQSSEQNNLYYNNGIEMAVLNNKNTMLKPSYFSFIASVSGNAKLNASVDLFAEFTCYKSQNELTKIDYFNPKKITNFGTNFGVKYYLRPRYEPKQTVPQQF